MKPKEIQEILESITLSGLEEVTIETENFKISTKKSVTQNVTAFAPASMPVAVSAPAAPAPVSTGATSAASPVATPAADAAVNSKLHTIKSPMIGTFYRSPNPESESFVNVGDSISSGQTVCIIEAMKLFNEIESEVSGKIVKILVENSSPVEFDQPLFLVELS